MKNKAVQIISIIIAAAVFIFTVVMVALAGVPLYADGVQTPEPYIESGIFADEREYRQYCSEKNDPSRAELPTDETYLFGATKKVWTYSEGNIFGLESYSCILPEDGITQSSVSLTIDIAASLDKTTGRYTFVANIGRYTPEGADPWPHEGNDDFIALLIPHMGTSGMKYDISGQYPDGGNLICSKIMYSSSAGIIWRITERNASGYVNNISATLSFIADDPDHELSEIKLVYLHAYGSDDTYPSFDYIDAYRIPDIHVSGNTKYWRLEVTASSKGDIS